MALKVLRIDDSPTLLPLVKRTPEPPGYAV
jgi:hypothetical protein